ncbi:MAG: CvpA family protein [Candidatus Eisenbacteria bacterium]|nr:CvpA family protein [Candidatus Eisenbacteria bacterium]
MNATDIIIGVILIAGLISGVARGFVRGLFGLAGLVLGVMIAAGNYGFVSRRVFGFVSDERLRAIVAFMAVLIVVLVLFSILGKLLSKAVRLAEMGWADRLAGAFLGLLTASLLSGMLLILAVMGGVHGERFLADSVLAPKVLAVTDAVVSVFPGAAQSRIEEAREELRREWNRQRGRGTSTLVLGGPPARRGPTGARPA